ncbi:Cation/H(+) antiporter 18 [Apostasia shenzhenica]|uniref:Cation/H(+) antiporter 18 n=1 Tax=Apostasia shenzhenica TaxID=1088818 RepID=A0A2I0A012_9ASPA|nr:Cation/H(+) antiporter 18 [Apostasia shenzhenica]
MDKRAALIVLPFHKVQRLDGGFESLGAAHQSVNRRVLLDAPCSVSVLIDRGLGGDAHIPASDVAFSVAVLFFGDADDREALAYGSRIAEHPGIALTLFRFVPTSGGVGDDDADELAIKRFCSKAGTAVREAVADGGARLTAAIQSAGRFNLFLVGRRAMAAAMLERTDCPELGPVGSYLVSPWFSPAASVLVVQSYESKLGNNASLSESAVETCNLPDTPPVAVCSEKSSPSDQQDVV